MNCCYDLDYYTPIQLKLYTMHQKVTAPIDDTYTANAYSAEILEFWYNHNCVVGNLAICVSIFCDHLPLHILHIHSSI